MLLHHRPSSQVNHTWERLFITGGVIPITLAKPPPPPPRVIVIGVIGSRVQKEKIIFWAWARVRSEGIWREGVWRKIDPEMSSEAWEVVH